MTTRAATEVGARESGVSHVSAKSPQAPFLVRDYRMYSDGVGPEHILISNHAECQRAIGRHKTIAK
jgi:hypothetical protein